MHSLTASDIWLRVLASFAAGAIIGWERETHGRAAGLRTTILACVAASLAMIISETLFIQSAAFPGLATARPDPARLGAGVLTGIGFLGGGAILRHGNFIRGVTTAASLWFATMIGLALGGGLFWPALLGVTVGLITLNLLPHVERHIRKDAYAQLKIVVRPETLTLPELRSKLNGLGLEIVALTTGADKEKGVVRFNATLKTKRQDVFDKADRAMALFTAWPGVIKVAWK